MGCIMRLGSKADVFHLEGQNWLCITGLPSDVCIIIEDVSFHLHKFPLSSRSQFLEELIQEKVSNQTSGDEKECVLSLHDLPGGAKAFLLIAKFCYGVKIEITPADIVSIRCAAEYLKMTEDYGNLVSKTVNFLDQVLKSWTDTVKALETCYEMLPFSEELHIISRCIDTLATKACSNLAILSPQVSGHNEAYVPWNGINSTSNPGAVAENWWYDDVAILQLPLFKRLIVAVGLKGMTPGRISGAVMYYAKRYLPLNGRQDPTSTVHLMSDANDQRALIEEIIMLLPHQKGATPTNFLLRLLRTSMILHASRSCQDILERRIGDQLDEAALQDLLIPNAGEYVETLYDVDCVQRIVNHFLFVDQEDVASDFEEDRLVDGHQSLEPMIIVANLVDDYLAEVAPDVNLKLEKFMILGGAIPNYARPSDDGIYRAIDIYLKAHPWLTDSEREHLCRLMNCQKLSLEASTHAAQNERLPLRVMVQVLFFEQLRLRTSVAGWFFVSENLNSSQNMSGGNDIAQGGNDRFVPAGDEIVTFDDMRERVSELEKECKSMRRDIEKLVKAKRVNWNNFYKRFGLRFRVKSFDLKSVVLACNGDAFQPKRRAVLNRKLVAEGKVVGC